MFCVYECCTHMFYVFVDSERSTVNQTLRVLRYDINLEFPACYAMFKHDLNVSLIQIGNVKNIRIVLKKTHMIIIIIIYYTELWAILAN